MIFNIPTIAVIALLVALMLQMLALTTTQNSDYAATSAQAFRMRTLAILYSFGALALAFIAGAQL